MPFRSALIRSSRVIISTRHRSSKSSLSRIFLKVSSVGIGFLCLSFEFSFFIPSAFLPNNVKLPAPDLAGAGLVITYWSMCNGNLIRLHTSISRVIRSRCITAEKIISFFFVLMPSLSILSVSSAAAIPLSSSVRFSICSVQNKQKLMETVILMQLPSFFCKKLRNLQKSCFFLALFALKFR